MMFEKLKSLFVKAPARMKEEPLLPIPKLSWDEIPELKKVSYFLYSASHVLETVFDVAYDIKEIRPDWHQLNTRKKMHIISEVLIQIAKHESNWDIKFQAENGRLLGLTGQVLETMAQAKLPFGKEELLTPKANMLAAIRILSMQVFVNKKIFADTRRTSFWECLVRTSPNNAALREHIKNV